MIKSKIYAKLLIFAVFLLGFTSTIIIGYASFNALSKDSFESMAIGDWMTIGDPISSAQDFYNMVMNANSQSDDSYYLENDIDFSGFNWVIDATNFNTIFRGTLDGNGYAINNLTLTNNDSTFTYFGIFPQIEGATVKNLSFNNVDLSLGANGLSSTTIMSGLIAGNVIGLTNTIDNITIINSGVRGTSTSGTGGLVGHVDGATTILNIDNVKTTSLKVFSTTASAGGLVGTIDNGAQVYVNDIDLDGEVSAMDFSSYSAGVVGTVTPNAVFNVNRAILNITSQNTLETSSAYYLLHSQRFLGGVIGLNESTSTNVSISNTFFTGSLITFEAKKYNYIGTAIGESTGSETITNSFYSMVEFLDRRGNVVLQAPGRERGVMLPVVNDASMPNLTWWNTFATDFLSANTLWAQDASGQLYLIR